MTKKLESLAFAIIIAAAFTIFPALANVDSDTLSHPAKWLVSLAVAVVVAVGTAGYAWSRANLTLTVNKADVPMTPLTSVSPTSMAVPASTGAVGPTVTAMYTTEPFAAPVPLAPVADNAVRTFPTPIDASPPTSASTPV